MTRARTRSAGSKKKPTLLETFFAKQKLRDRAHNAAQCLELSSNLQWIPDNTIHC
jgi:hypothetical protein